MQSAKADRKDAPPQGRVTAINLFSRDWLTKEVKLEIVADEGEVETIPRPSGTLHTPATPETLS